MREARLEGGVPQGRCLLIVEGQERPLEPWDFVHCPPRTPHTIVATGSEPALVLAVGARVEQGSVRYPVEPAAIRHGAGVEHATASPDEAYAASASRGRVVGDHSPAPEHAHRLLSPP